MITADKIYRNQLEVQRVYQGLSLLWELAAEPALVYSWSPTTYISTVDDLEYYNFSTTSLRKTDKVQLTLPANIAAVNAQMYYDHPKVNDQDVYMKAYALDSTSSVKCTLNADTGIDVGYSPGYEFKLDCTQFPGDNASHSIQFESYSGYYYFSGTHKSIIHPPQFITQPTPIVSTYTNKSILFNNSGVWTYYIDNKDADSWSSSFQIQGKGVYNFSLNLTSGLENGEYASGEFYITDLDSDVKMKELIIQYNTGGSTKSATVRYTTSDDNPHTIKIGGSYPNWGKYTAKITVSTIVSTKDIS